MSILQRVANWLANEVIVKSLARSETFQKLAVKTHHHVQTVKKEGMKTVEELKTSDSIRNAQETMNAHIKTASTFKDAFLKNIKELSDAQEYKKLEEEGRRAR